MVKPMIFPTFPIHIGIVISIASTPCLSSILLEKFQKPSVHGQPSSYPYKSLNDLISLILDHSFWRIRWVANISFRLFFFICSCSCCWIWRFHCSSFSFSWSWTVCVSSVWSLVLAVTVLTPIMMKPLLRKANSAVKWTNCRERQLKTSLVDDRPPFSCYPRWWHWQESPCCTGTAGLSHRLHQQVYMYRVCTVHRRMYRQKLCIILSSSVFPSTCSFNRGENFKIHPVAFSQYILHTIIELL